MFYKNQLLSLVSNEYVTAPEQLWLVESIVGSTLFGEVLSKSKTLNDSFFELLFSRADTSFYLDAHETWLVGYNDELTRADYGPLTPISLLEAVRQFGLLAVEQAKEKTAVRL